jgi:hypothetical protein
MLSIANRSTLPLYAALLLATSAPLSAQNDYAFNWHNMSSGFLGGAAFVSGQALFGFGQPGGGVYGPGSSIRLCYGIDSTQGGRMQTLGAADVNWFTLVQGYSPSSPLPGTNYGLVSLQAASVDSLAGDACFSSAFSQGLDPLTGQPITLHSTLGFTSVLGVIPGTAGLPAPVMWSSSFQFLGSTGLLVANTKGVQPGSFAAPLLTHLILEVQGPLNVGSGNNQYFVLSTAEVIGLGNGSVGAGGVANGNSRHGSSFFGASADITNMVSHNRLTSAGPAGLVGMTGTQFGGGPGTDQLFGSICTATPALWASQDRNTGGGGPDWRISSQTSLVDLRVIDVRSGAEGSALASPPGPATPITNPNLAANFPLFFWSATPAAGMLQSPLSWDAIPGQVAQAGSLALGPILTERGGFQTVPINLDSATLAFLGRPGFTIGSNYSAAEPNGILKGDGSGFRLPGTASLARGPLPVGPLPSLANRNIGVAALSVQFDGATGRWTLQEFASSLTLSIQ